MARVEEKSGAAAWLRVRGLGVRIDGHDLLGDIGFDLRKGELAALVGHNGAGKSTLLRCLAGLIDAPRGRIELAGRPLSSYTPRALARKVCYVAQTTERMPPFTVAEFVRQARYAHDDPFGAADAADAASAPVDAPTGPEADRAAVADALALTGMAALADRRLPTLSGGERQMAALAAALAQEAELLLLDEPAAFLDLRHQEAILSLLARLHRGRGLGCLMATHDVNAALHASRRVLGLREGRLLYDGPPAGLAEGGMLEKLFDSPFAFVAHPATGRPTVAAVGAEAARILDGP